MHSPFRLFSTLGAVSTIALLGGCGSGDENPPAPPTPPPFLISAPLVSPTMPPGVRVGMFNANAESRIIPTVSHYLDAQQNLLLHLNVATQPNAPDSDRNANFLTLSPTTGWSLGNYGTTHQMAGVLSTSKGLAYITRNGDAWFHSVLRHNELQPEQLVVSGTEQEVIVGPAHGNELVAARLIRDGDRYALETRKTTNGVWSVLERQAVQMPEAFATSRVVGGRTFNYESHRLRGVLSGAQGDVFHVSLRGRIVPFDPISPDYGGDYLLWRTPGSTTLQQIELFPLCSPGPLGGRGCLFYEFGGFQQVRLEAGGEITYFAPGYTSSGTLNDWKRAAAEPIKLLSTTTTQPLWQRDVLNFALAKDGRQRGWTTNNNGTEIQLGESAAGTPLVPVSWTSAVGERVPCGSDQPSFGRFEPCRIFRAESADRIAYFGWDKPAGKAFIYVSDRIAPGVWKNVGTRDVSELLVGLDPSARIYLNSFFGAGESDLIIGTLKKNDLEDVKRFAIRLSPKR